MVSKNVSGRYFGMFQFIDNVFEKLAPCFEPLANMKKSSIASDSEN